MALASSLNADGSEDFDLFSYAYEGGAQGSLMKQFDYVMNGKIFKYNAHQGKMYFLLSKIGVLDLC